MAALELQTSSPKHEPARPERSAVSPTHVSGPDLGLSDYPADRATDRVQSDGLPRLLKSPALLHPANSSVRAAASACAGGADRTATFSDLRDVRKGRVAHPRTSLIKGRRRHPRRFHDVPRRPAWEPKLSPPR